MENGADFEEKIKTGNVVVDFFATWCGPCRRMGQEMEELEESFPSITFLKVDTDRFGELAQQFLVASIPNMVFFQNGKRIPVKVQGENIESLVGGLDEESFATCLKDSFGI